MADIIEKELSYQIIGFCFEVHNELGKSAKEKYYQRAFEVLLQKNGIPYKKEIFVDMIFKDEKVGHYFIDFLVAGKIVVEFKAKPFTNKNDIKQVLDYLRITNLKLGLLINFGTDSLVCKRILNSQI